LKKVRSVVSDASGQYRIVDLRPGIYTVTFSLAGFGVIKREGIELTGSFTASVNAEMRVGAVQETITVSGELPTVDVQTTTQQKVMDREILDTIPVGRTPYHLGVLIPGATMGGAANPVGATSTASTTTMRIHGSRFSE
jgi:carboxypeptidase family protein